MSRPCDGRDNILGFLQPLLFLILWVDWFDDPTLFLPLTLTSLICFGGDVANFRRGCDTWFFISRTVLCPPCLPVSVEQSGYRKWCTTNHSCNSVLRRSHVVHTHSAHSLFLRQSWLNSHVLSVAVTLRHETSHCIPQLCTRIAFCEWKTCFTIISRRHRHRNVFCLPMIWISFSVFGHSLLTYLFSISHEYACEQ